MDDIIIGLSDYYNWLPLYCQYTIFEYERFMHLLNLNEKLMCPDIIKQCWEYHILNIDHYYKYCIKRFNKVLIYVPRHYSNMEKREQVKIYKEFYFKHYDRIAYDLVWIENKQGNIVTHDVQKNIILHIDKKRINYSLILNENILDLKDLISKKFNINISNINIFLENENSSFNLQQIYQLYNYKYFDNAGLPNYSCLPDKINLLDLYHGNYSHLRIYLVK